MREEGTKDRESLVNIHVLTVVATPPSASYKKRGVASTQRLLLRDTIYLVLPVFCSFAFFRFSRAPGRAWELGYLHVHHVHVRFPVYISHYPWYHLPRSGGTFDLIGQYIAAGKRKRSGSLVTKTTKSSCILFRNPTKCIHCKNENSEHIMTCTCKHRAIRAKCM